MECPDHDFGCGCDGGYDRREFLGAMGTALGGAVFTSVEASPGGAPAAPASKKQGAMVRVAFLYPPSATFADRPDGWWSWPGNFFDAEGRHRQFAAAFQAMEKRLGVQLRVEPKPVADPGDADRLAQDLQANRPDGLLLVMFFNRSLALADALLAAAQKAQIPVIFYIGLGVKHGPVKAYRRGGVYFIQSLDNLDAIEYGLRMIQAKRLMGQSTLLSVVDAKGPSEAVEPFFGTKIRVVPFSRYAAEFEKVAIDDEARRFIAAFTGGAQDIQGITQEAKENAARAHLVLRKILAEEGADGLTMNCLRRGMLKPCISFATLNNQLIPAACENDFAALHGQMLGQLLTGRPGFQHNPCYETERNHYYGSHCTCPTKLYGPDGPQRPYLLRRFAHTNEGSCATQVFWKEGEPVTMIHYYGGKAPALDVYAGTVVKSHAMPPAGGCTTNVEIALTDRSDACMVAGHHNVLFCGDYARKFRLFAQLYHMKLVESGFAGPWPV